MNCWSNGSELLQMQHHPIPGVQLSKMCARDGEDKDIEHQAENIGPNVGLPD
jgi:hypothetical protein